MILAADPGLSGGLATYDAASGDLTVKAMPTTPKARKGKPPLQVLDEGALLNLFASWALHGVEVFYVEAVGGRPGQSGSAAFNFGQGYGALRMAALAAGMRIETVPPATWKTAMKAPKDKTASRHRASELFPKHAGLWPLKKHDGLAEAAMLAMYGAREEGRNNA